MLDGTSATKSLPAQTSESILQLRGYPPVSSIVALPTMKLSLQFTEVKFYSQILRGPATLRFTGYRSKSANDRSRAISVEDILFSLCPKQ